MTARLGPTSLRAGLEVRADDRGRCGRGPQQLGEPIVLDERDVAWARLADRPRRADRDAAIADQATAYQFRKLFHRCDHGRFPFFLERRRRVTQGVAVERSPNSFVRSGLSRLDMFRERVPEGPRRPSGC